MSNTQDPIPRGDFVARLRDLAATKLSDTLGPHHMALVLTQEIAKVADDMAALQSTTPQPPGFDAHDMATAAADGFRDGVASVRPPGDAREAVYQVRMKAGPANSAWLDCDEGTYNSAKLLPGEYVVRVLYATAQASEPSADAPLLREFLDEAERAGVTHLNEYGSTDLPQEIVGVSMTDGEKRLARLLMIALGTRHPAFDDFVALLMSKNPAPPRAVEPLTDEQIEKIKAKPECWEHVGQRIEFRYRPFARAIERAHGITTTPAAKEQS